MKCNKTGSNPAARLLNPPEQTRTGLIGDQPANLGAVGRESCEWGRVKQRNVARRPIEGVGKPLDLVRYWEACCRRMPHQVSKHKGVAWLVMKAIQRDSGYTTEGFLTELLVASR